MELGSRRAAQETQGRRAVVVDDEEDIRLLVQHVLEQLGLEVVGATTGEEGLEAVRRTDPDLVTLDLSLPDLDGVEVCRRLREFSNAYVVMVTGRVEEADRLAGLEVGADDYLSKPFSPRELHARAAALLRRPRAALEGTAAATPAAGSAGSAGSEAPSPVEAGGGLVLVPVEHVALLDGRPLPLTPAEVSLLTAFATAPGRTWERGDLVREVWQGDFIESDFLVDVHVASLRRKLRKASPTDHEWIRTVGGVGYAFAPADPADPA